MFPGRFKKLKIFAPDSYDWFFTNWSGTAQGIKVISNIWQNCAAGSQGSAGTICERFTPKPDGEKKLARRHFRSVDRFLLQSRVREPDAITIGHELFNYAL
jgi:hypothetical protein